MSAKLSEKTETKTKVKPVKEKKVKRMPVPQVRVLRALKRAKGRALTRGELNERSGFSPLSGTINRALGGVAKDAQQVKSGSANPQKGLVDAGLVKKRKRIDETAGINEWVYEITPAGDKALEDFDGTVGEVREAKLCVNQRYVKQWEKDKAKRAKEREKTKAEKETKPKVETTSNGHKENDDAKVFRRPG